MLRIVIAILVSWGVAHAETPVEKAKAVVEKWLEAQNTGKLADYTALYAKGFRGIRRSGAKTVRLDRAGWMKERGKMFKNPMKVTVDKLVLEAARGGARARFVQTFTQGKYSDTGDKEIVIEGGRIVREEMLSSTKPGANGATCDTLRCKDTSTPAAIIETCTKACDGGDKSACREKAAATSFGSCGLAKDENAAAKLYEKACSADDGMACTFAAETYAKTDEAKAIPLYKTACTGGDPYGCYALATLYLEGKTTKHDVKAAVALLATACNDYDRSAPGSSACHDLAAMYRDGTKGVKKDKATADEWQRKYDQSQQGE